MTTTDERRGRVAIVTGGADSVGRATAEKFYALGDRVAIIDVNQQNLQSTLTACPGMIGEHGSVDDPVAVERLFAQAIDAFGRVDILVNCVGVSGPTAAIEDVSLEDWAKTLAVNVGGVFHCMQLAARTMKAQRSGVIVNYSSASTKVGLPNRTPYVASKMAVEALTFTAARELGPFNVRCNAILPGIIDNERMRGIIATNAEQRNLTVEDMEAKYLQFVSMRTKIGLQELVDLTVYLCSDGARHLTGQMIELSGLLEWEE